LNALELIRTFCVIKYCFENVLYYFSKTLKYFIFNLLHYYFFDVIKTITVHLRLWPLFPTWHAPFKLSTTATRCDLYEHGLNGGGLRGTGGFGGGMESCCSMEQCIKAGGATSSSKPSSCDFDFLCLDWRLPGHLPQRLAAFVIAPQRNFHMIIFIRWNMPPSRVGSTASVRPVEATPALHATLFGTERNKKRYVKCS